MTRALLLGTVLCLHGAVARAQGTAFSPPVECAPPAQPGTQNEMRARAQEHFSTAARVYDLGEYERAVEEFTASFCLFKTPEAVKNIGQSHYSLLEFKKAIDWWEYYLHLLPASEQEKAKTLKGRIERLKKLKARVRVTTDPVGAAITISGTANDGTQTLVHGKGNDPEPLRVLAGTYTMRVELAGYQTEVEEIAPEIGQPYTYSYRLRPETGVLRVTADPPGARIFVDRRLVGAGSYDERVATGAHLILVEAEGRVPEERTVLVTARQASDLIVKLDVPPRNGRAELLAGATAWGLISGGTIGVLLQQDTAYIFTFAGGTASFILSYVTVPDRVSVGVSSTAVGASLWGGLEGMATALLFTTNENWVAPVTIGSSAAFGAGGAVVADKLRLTSGDAALVNSGALWGTVTGMLTYQSFTDDNDPLDGLGPPLALAGVNAGLLGGITLARRYEVSRAHIALIDLSGMTGTLIGLGVGAVFEDQTQSARPAHFMMGGMAGGLIAGAILTRNFDETAAPTRSIASLHPLFWGTDRGAPTVGLMGTF